MKWNVHRREFQLFVNGGRCVNRNRVAVEVSDDYDYEHF